MSRLAKFAALLLLALWLPATLHCRLEGVGLAGLFTCPEASAQAEHSDDNTAHADNCQTIESGQFAVIKSRIVPALLPAPVCVFVHCLLHVAPPAPAPEIFACSQTEPLLLQRTWQFVRRAALPARAPDLIA